MTFLFLNVLKEGGGSTSLGNIPKKTEVQYEVPFLKSKSHGFHCGLQLNCILPHMDGLNRCDGGIMGNLDDAVAVQS